ncbi:MAG TPA: flagellar motor protein MotA [Desulfobacteraceae bacterium]|nr:MotA/TolQ/ExbB proton channel family protein [Deltaproteobacteria bacterium]HDZ23814.1 flagellar motor protein MotA [Desulfobacteraceae bacterium]
MEQRTVIGLGICAILIAFGFAVNGNVGLYFNIAALFIVLGGTFGAAFLSFRTERLSIVFKVLFASYRTRMKAPEEIVGILVDLSVKSRLKGVLSLQEDEDEMSIMFLRRALGFLVDGYSEAQIKEILNTEMYFFKLRREESERVLRTLAEICPSFGLVGSVVGLIGMLASAGDVSLILTTIPIALTSTLYGVVFANLFFLPFAAHMRERTDHELLLQKIILEGVSAIENELNPRVLEIKLKSFLTPSSREGRIISVKRIQERFKIKPEVVNPGPGGSRILQPVSD